uniref:Uncharacterized protein n=1 Tax=Rhizophora mucronata TaxID=61149 RepID=A0A2P2NA75_RHIMU
MRALSNKIEMFPQKALVVLETTVLVLLETSSAVGYINKKGLQRLIFCVGCQ